MRQKIANLIFNLLDEFSYFDRAISENGIVERLSELEKIIGNHSNTSILTDNNIRKAFATLSGQDFHETQADLNQAPLAERIKKIEEILKIKFVIKKTRGYEKK